MLVWLINNSSIVSNAVVYSSKAVREVVTSLTRFL